VTLAVAMAAAPGVTEELFFRGFVQVRLVERLGGLAGIAVTALLFGLLHFDLVQSRSRP